jgi:SAM-dependent methyltransferase
MQARSALRRAQDKFFSRLTLNGRVLDVGGAPTNDYHRLIGGTHTITFGNLYRQYDPDIVFDAQDTWPVANASQDAVIMNNLLEHLARPQECLAEARRVLKPDGKLVGSTPFLYRVHAGPGDYFRFTDEGLRSMLMTAGFSRISISILGSGAFAAAFDLVGTPFRRLPPVHYGLQQLAEWVDALCNAFRPKGQLSREICPLGYFFEALG